MNRLYRIVLQVEDIDEATAFYRELLGERGDRVSAGRHYFDCGGTILACFDPPADGDAFEASPNPDHVYFAVPDLEGMRERAGSLDGALSLTQIERQPWGERCFYMKDPFGNPLCFVDDDTLFTG